MSKLDELREFVKKQFEQAETNDKTTIDMLAKINTAVEDVTKEHDELTAKNAELIKSYKDLVKHTSFNDSEKKPTDPVGTLGPSFEDVLKQFAEKE